MYSPAPSGLYYLLGWAGTGVALRVQGFSPGTGVPFSHDIEPFQLASVGELRNWRGVIAHLNRHNSFSCPSAHLGGSPHRTSLFHYAWSFQE